MRIEDFNDRLKHAVIVADGAMGSLLYESVGPQRSVDELNSSDAESVFRVHQTYIEAGAQVIETNTFGANRHKLAQIGMADRVAELNHRGVNLFLVETFSDLDELLTAIDAIRSFSNLPIVAEMTYSEEGATMGGMRPQDAWEKLKVKNIQAVGANCTVGPQYLLPVIRELNGIGMPLSAMPNAGFPKRVGDRIVYPKSSPEYFALFAEEAADLGVRLLGGCCGTTPEHIRAMAIAMKKLRPPKSGTDGKAASIVEVLEPQERTKRIKTREPESKLWKKLQAQEFAVSVEIDPPKGVSIDRIVEQVSRVMNNGHVDAIDINSGTLARVGMDALVLAGALEAHG